MTTPTEAPREALPEPLEVVAWKSPMWRFYPTRFNAVQNGEQLLDALVRLTDAQSALESECQAHAAEVERLRARLAFLTQPGALRFVEEDSGMYRVYEDEAPPERETHFWQSVTSLYYPSAAEAIDAAIDQAIARGTK